MPVILPESKSVVVEDGYEALLPETKVEDGEELVDLKEPDKAAAKPEKKPEASAPEKKEVVEQPAVDDDVPPALRGKTPAQLAKMYRDAQALIGRQGQELGEMRRKADLFIQADLEARAARKREEAAAAEKKPAEDDDVEFFAKPKEAVLKAIENSPVIQEIRKALGERAAVDATQRAESATKRFNDAHPDASEILQDPEFRTWVGASRVRQALLKRAHEKFDFDAGDEVFGTWKALRGVKAAPAKDPAAEAAAEAEAVKAAAKTLAKRKEALKAAATPTGGNATPEGTTGTKKVYRRADVLRLMEEQPERYGALATEIELAYREGRVR